PPDPGQPDLPPVLLGLGRLNVVKGFDLAIEAMPSILEAHPEVRLRLVGDGPERGRLEAQVVQLGLQEKVEFTGMVGPEAIWEHYRQSTLVLAPSRSEGMPYVLLEAGAAARPVIASRVDGNAEAVLDGETGLLIDPESPEQLSEQTIRLLEEPALARQLGQRARERIGLEFTVEGFANAFESLYRELARG
ncbi:MAG: glycosyltransferase family 4 protein, partial [Candidatus Eremiobacteraeota bacterium]|nr:glycosyltransferase family 4 protein [Candidatus Eremiobacteraeota bacterium]